MVGHKYSIMMFYRYWPELVFVVVFRFLSKHFLFDELMGREGWVLVGQLLVARAIYDSSAGPSVARSLGHPLSWLFLSREQDFSWSVTLFTCKIKK